MTKLIIKTELFEDEGKPRRVLACEKCGQAYKTRHDVINFCSNCGERIEGTKPLGTDAITIEVVSQMYEGIDGKYYMKDW